jgi:hypothetical protein
VRFKEHANTGSLIQPSLQFSYVEMRFLMLAEGSTLGISFLFLESLCRKTQSSCARVLLMAANCVVSAVSNGSVRIFAGHVCYCSERADNRNWKWHPGSRFDQFLFPHFGFVSAKPNTVCWCYYWDGSVASSCVRAKPAT